MVMRTVDLFRHTDNDGDELTPEGVQAAVLQAYRDDREPAQVAERLVDFDEGFMEWRYHHVKMVERTIGSRVGTGGYGAEYLRSTLHKPFFPDLWTIRSEL